MIKLGPPWEPACLVYLVEYLHCFKTEKQNENSVVSEIT